MVYNSTTGRRLYKKHQFLEVYKLVEGKYQLLPAVALLPEGGNMVWLPEIGLGIGCEQDVRDGWQREWMYWYDRSGVRFPTAQERAIKAEAIADQERQRKQQAEQKTQRLAEMLRAMGVNPDEI